MKKIIAILASFVLIAALGTVVVGLGPATVTIINAVPQATGLDILEDPGYNSVTAVDPSYGVQIPYHFNVTIEDTNAVGNIENVTISLHKYGREGWDDPLFSYAAWFNQTDATQGQILPTGLEVYFTSIVFTPLDATHANCSFTIYLNGTATEDTNWRFKANVTDILFTNGIGMEMQFTVNPGAGLTYYGNAGGNSFHWDGWPEANISATFYTETTTNGNYTLNMSYSGAFAGGAVPWGAPTMWVNEIGQPVSLPVTTGAGAAWYGQAGIHYNHNATHHLYLEIPPGLTIGDNYGGVTIFVYATNT